MSIDFIFPTPIFYSKPDVDISGLYNTYARLKQIDENGSKNSNQGGWQSEKISARRFDAVLNQFKVTIERYANDEIIDSYGLNKSKTRFSMSQLWFNCNTNSNHNSPHIHGPDAFLSAAYYVKVPKSLDIQYPADERYTNKEVPGGIKFLKDYDDLYYMCKILPYLDKTTACNCEFVTYYPTEGTLLIFPSNLIHSVAPTNVDEERISISFDMVMEHF